MDEDAIQKDSWKPSESVLGEFVPANFVVELEGIPTPQGISRCFAELVSKRNKAFVEYQKICGQYEYLHALTRIEKAQALQAATGTVKDKEATAEVVTKEQALSLASLKGSIKVLNHLLENLSSTQDALRGQLKALAIQNDLTKE